MISNNYNFYYLCKNNLFSDMDDLIDVCVKHMAVEGFSEEQARVYMKEKLPKLNYWKNYKVLSDNGQFEVFKKKLIKEIYKNR